MGDRRAAVGWTQEVPSAPGRWPLLGHAVPLMRQPLDFVRSLSKTGPLARVDLGGLSVLFVTDMELTKEVFTRHAPKMTKGRLFDNMEALVGCGLATADRETHRVHRRIIQPLFAEQHLARYAETMTKQAVHLADSLWAGQELSVERVMSDYSINTLTATMFAADLDPQAVTTVRESVRVILDTMLKRAVMPPWADRLPIPPNRRFLAASRRIREVIEGVIADTPRSDLAERTDLVATLLAARDRETGDRLSDSEVRDELATMLFAGTETTASTLAWALHELATHPEAEQQALEELDAVLGGPRPVTFEDTKKMPYLRSVLEETLRLHGVTLLMRRTVEPVNLGGVEIPAGTEIALSLYALHRDGAVFGSDAAEFDPDRMRTHGNYLPFGAGNRKCIGNDFSWTESLITLATLLPRWQLRPAAGYAPREALAAMASPTGIRMTAHERERATASGPVHS
ncbi:cytochrome P450 [Streptomyces albus]|uniref:cytochrome P450 n=1 Tax=Streptomyces albus TaxID=1888 RepID=UPI0037002778